MALIPCPECQREVSTQALACPQCAFPYPGKQGISKGAQSHTLSSCPGCGFLVSRQAKSCPHCGHVLGEQIHQTGHENISEETWLCPHCGVPYTRKVKRQENANFTPEETTVSPQPDNAQQNSETATEENATSTEIKSPFPLSSPPPLWQDPSARKETPYPRYPRNRRKSIVVGLIIFVLVTASIVLGALWQYQGITPLEALFFWQN